MDTPQSEHDRDNPVDGEGPMHDWWSLTADEQAALAPYDHHPVDPSEPIAVISNDGEVRLLQP